MRLLTKYNTQGWVLSGGRVGECAGLLPAQGQALPRSSEEGIFGPHPHPLPEGEGTYGLRILTAWNLPARGLGRTGMPSRAAASFIRLSVSEYSA